MKKDTYKANSQPPFRKLRGYAFDPASSLNMDTADINEIIYKVPWEELKPGPDGEYIKVIDRDPPSDAVYWPVDLNDPAILATDGLTPSESNPQFHQQMVYAVMMYTIKNFERALGRRIFWGNVKAFDNGRMETKNIRQLAVFPHAIRDQNAYYSPDRKALLFGYYNSTPINAGVFLPGGITYSCLSHDIIAHETVHAILDGIYDRYMEITNPDTPAFHEGFSDIVALMQHFTYPEIVKNQIRLVRGELDTENMLVKLAVEFGQSTGEYHSLRDGIGQTGDDGKWTKKTPSITDYETNIECHDRGALLVAAVFDAYIAIYKNRTADLVRLATGGTGIVPAGEIHPDLVNRLAEEAGKAASHVLAMCIRALDYCPPVDITYGDFLRAIITADKELVASDDHNYRIAFINAFRKRGIFPENVPNLSVDTLCYKALEDEGDVAGFSNKIVKFLRGFKERLAYQTNRSAIFDETQKFIGGDDDQKGFHFNLFNKLQGSATAFEDLTGLVLTRQFKKLGINKSGSYDNRPAIEMAALRIVNKPGPGGNIQSQIIMCLIQNAWLFVDEDSNGNIKFLPLKKTKKHKGGESMSFRGGCTLIFDLDNLKLRHAVRKPIFDPYKAGSSRRSLKINQHRCEMQYRCTVGDLSDKLGFSGKNSDEAFAAIHESQSPIL